MNKQRVNELIPKAYEQCDRLGITREYRSQISAFGSAISTGSLLAAVAFFSDKGNASVDRSKLMDAIGRMLDESDERNLYEKVKSDRSVDQKNKILDCAIAIKLALNLLAPEGEKNKKSKGPAEGGQGK